MPGRVLVVDDVLPNVKLLEAKLSSEYFDVLSAYDGPEALKVIEDQVDRGDDQQDQDGRKQDPKTE